MDLFELTVGGFKRFRVPTSLKTNGKLVAIVGPNEAGKTSLLLAIRYLGNDEPIPDNEISRGCNSESFTICGTFLLSKDDRQAAHLDTACWLRVTKSRRGPRQLKIHPASPERDLSLRGALSLSLSAALSVPRIVQAAGDTIDGFSDLTEEVQGVLSSDNETLSSDDIDSVVDYVEQITGFIKPRDPAAIRKIATLVSEWAETEKREAPNSLAIRVLRDRMPSILVFGENERALKSEYDLGSLSTEVPIALENLCDIAELELSDVVAAYKSGNTARLTTLEYAANRVLERRFSESWQQSGVHVSIRIQGSDLLIQVVNETSEFTSFAERSDGLRQFVALQSFAMANWSNRPVLVIDEAEQKLHYDAQADLVQMLARQEVASKVIYTTHSAGCLPEDLGNGVRFARPSVEDATRSEVVNKFWAEKEPGFAPLLFGMGASTLAFFPTRNAIMVEGPSDMLVLPSLMREALEREVLGFQVIPGLAEIDKTLSSPILSKASGVLYLVDGDAAGVKIKDAVSALGVDERNIFSLRTSDGSAVELEDFVEPGVLIAAANALLDKFHGAVQRIEIGDVSTRERTKSLRKVFKERTSRDLPKVDLAYEILDISLSKPESAMLDKKRKNAFSGICQQIYSRFGEVKHGPSR